MPLQKDRGRGRPQTPLVDRLRVSFWSHSVLLASGLRRVQELEALLGKKHKLVLASGLWSRYMRGEVVPQGALTGATNSLVMRIGKVFPETSGAFYTPLWELLTWTSVLDFNSLRSIYLSMDERVHIHFVARANAAGERVASKTSQFWHLKKSIAARRDVIDSLGVWDRLIACLLEARMSYAAQNIDAFTDCQLMASQILEDLTRTPEFGAKRLQGVLLAMQALCLDALFITIVESAIKEEARDRCRTAMNRWKERCGSHIQSLSKNSQIAFIHALQRGSLIGSRVRW